MRYKVYDTLRENFGAGTLDANALLEGAKQGLVKAAGDPYTEYLNEQSAQELEESLNGTFSGVGAEIAIKNVSDLYLYPNTVATVKVTGAEVLEWLEMSAGQFKQIDPNASGEQALINTDFPTYNYDVIDGVTYEIDVTEPAKYDKDGKVINAEANRIKNLQYNGAPINLSQEFIVVTNNYRASGKFPGVRNNTGVELYPDENRQAIIDYIRELGTIDPSADGNWTFAPVGGAVDVSFDSSRDAVDSLPESNSIRYDGEAENGFGRYILQLPTEQQ